MPLSILTPFFASFLILLRHYFIYAIIDIADGDISLITGRHRDYCQADYWPPFRHWPRHTLRRQAYAMPLRHYAIIIIID
jgi:hypothetical protein